MSREWEEYIDLDTLVRFYIIHEMLDNIESFTGSCFIHKQYGNDSKLIYGPVWDFGNSFGHGLRQPNCFLYENSTMKKIWITELVKFPRFQQMVRLIWNEKKEFHNEIEYNDIYNINKEIEKFSNEISLKKETINNLLEQYKSINYIIERNKLMDHSIDENKKIYCPFIFFEIPNVEKDITRPAQIYSLFNF